jgi:uncharacterized iron-regulated membrane protein
MGFWKQPQKTWVRRAMFQIHLWTGVATGLYIIFISVTGSIVVFRRDLQLSKLGNIAAADADTHALMTDAQLRRSILNQYPGWYIDRLVIPRRKLSPAEAVLTLNGDKVQERFNKYTGADMGEMRPWSIRAMEWTTDLHDNLLAGDRGRKINALFGGLLCLLCITGLVIWWRGSRTWHKGFYFNPTHGWKRINFDLHASLGLWSIWLLFIWGLTGVYFAYPEPFNAIVDYFEPGFTPGRTGDAVIAWFVKMHFGRYGGMGVRITYVIVGLTPAVMFVTGAYMWWNRVLRRWVAETRAPRERSAFAAPAAVVESVD